MKQYDPTEILRRFALEDVHDQKVLDRYLTSYPEMAVDFIDFLHDLRLTEELPSVDVEPESRQIVDAAFSRLIGSRETTAAASLFDGFKGKAFVDLAKAVNVPRGFLIAIRDRLVIFTTVPNRFIQRLATAMNERSEILREYLVASATPNSALSFRSDTQPRESDPISFSKLIECTEMSDEQRAQLAEDLRDHGCK